MQILAIISGGCLVEVLADQPSTVILIDHDNIMTPAEETAMKAVIQAAKDSGMTHAPVTSP